jgi:hypothetical protein
MHLVNLFKSQRIQEKALYLSGDKILNNCDDNTMRFLLSHFMTNKEKQIRQIMFAMEMVKYATRNDINKNR